MAHHVKENLVFHRSLHFPFRFTNQRLLIQAWLVGTERMHAQCKDALRVEIADVYLVF